MLLHFIFVIQGEEQFSECDENFKDNRKSMQQNSWEASSCSTIKVPDELKRRINFVRYCISLYTFIHRHL
jgi:hypothetical protein